MEIKMPENNCFQKVFLKNRCDMKVGFQSVPYNTTRSDSAIITNQINLPNSTFQIHVK